jgi:hypothetical protein
MPYFHATAVFEARGSSPEEADRTATALFKTIRHPRIRYYEHDTSGGISTAPQSDSLYFTVIADFDVEAGNEESATDLVEEVFDFLSNETVHYFTHGITSGEQRVRPEPRAQHRAERPPAREAQAEQGDREERGGRKRGTRGRGRRRGGAREAEEIREEEPEGVLTSSLPEERADSSQEERVETSVATVALSPEVSEEGTTTVEVRVQTPEPPLPTPATVEAEPLLSPPRSSAAMHVTLTVTLHASELALPTNGSTLPEQSELSGLAMAEARRRHPELPAESIPECKVASLPWGDTLLTLTWHYDVPVPSSTEA